MWRWLSGDDTVRRSTVAAWLVLVVAALFVVQGTLRFDFRDKPVAGDQTSYLMQALSIEGAGHNLSYDAADMDRWREVGWVPSPTSLFYQRTASGWAFAKPYVYSLYLAAFIAAFGVVGGVAVAGSFLVLALVALSIAILRTRYRGPAVPLVVLAFVFASYAYFYAYVISEDLFLTVVTAAVGFLILRAWNSASIGWAAGAVALMAVTLPEKPQFLALFAPVGIALLWRQRSLARKVLVLVVAAAAFFAATYPYRHYSDGASWNAYQGSRYLAHGALPFDHAELAATTCPPLCHGKSGVSLTSPDGIRTRIEQGRGQFASAFYYLFGRYTGLLVFIPFALMTLGVVMILYWRRLDALAWAVLAGIVAYILLNVAVYPNNYYGGGQSLGDRYFLQMAPFVLLLLVTARVAVRTTIWISAIGIALGVAFLLPHHADPSNAYIRIDQTSLLQRLLPVERNQRNVTFFRCPIYGDCKSTAQVIKGFEP